jgi:hypothetical protein
METTVREAQGDMGIRHLATTMISRELIAVAVHRQVQVLAQRSHCVSTTSTDESQQPHTGDLIPQMSDIQGWAHLLWRSNDPPQELKEP